MAYHANYSSKKEEQKNLMNIQKPVYDDVGIGNL